jgi:acyl-CoA synthetase (AMP-forming)/AMP-acid ligase II
LLWDELTRAATLARPIWEWEGSDYREATYGDLLQGARRAAAGLRRLGVKPGEIVPAVITNGPEAKRGVAGVWCAGATIASLPIIARGMTIENYLAQLKELCVSLDASLLLADGRLLAAAGEDHGLGVELVDYASLMDTSDAAVFDPRSLDDVVFIQFSSGTTGQPRGVELTGRTIERQLAALVKHEQFDPDRDIGLMWLPMSHDMGFFGGFLAAWYSGVAGVISPPERFLADPKSWLDDCARFGATLTVAPPFALALAARAERLRPSSAGLSLRSCVVGAERIDWPVLEKAASMLARRGIGLDVITPAYGLAEATVAVTLADLDTPPRYVSVDAEAFAEGEVRILDPDSPERTAARRVVCCGTPLEGVGVRIDEDSGEIVVSGPILASGYHNDSEATQARFRDGELWTGDLGFIERGELYVIGRTDDIVIIGGRNVHAVEIEDALGSERGVRRGNCAIVDGVGDPGTQIALVAELDGDGIDARELSMRLRRASIEAAGVPIDRFVFLPKGAFPKTPSGKAQRYRCRAIARQPENAAEVVNLGVKRSAS